MNNQQKDILKRRLWRGMASNRDDIWIPALIVSLLSTETLGDSEQNLSDYSIQARKAAAAESAEAKTKQAPPVLSKAQLREQVQLMPLDQRDELLLKDYDGLPYLA
jgi:hypothetical protein